ncbi:c-type cytochrome biogenesis protein CcsB [Actinomycetospora endophytica]|uniref:C-type cytochrome biogenesis protein CcsB n=1 Tax=Actinomycetospora endophytica TaxID=2291215 RepID=A0ABS8P337_9PSEU|nr:c-type cytochrome biogenesis protein CcsB [Actinomycetospora endophytica]MCD2192660.1 c-type cytochrome biogenesis protein CcsB [Actinomycetospora endophytica]
MNVDAPLGDFGDVLFYSALAVYILAMLLHAVEHGMLRRVASAEAVPAAVPAAVGAGGGDEPGTTTVVPDDPAAGDDAAGDDPAPAGPRTRDGRPPRPASERFGRMGVSLTVLGLGLHIAMLVVRGVAADRPPWGNMYEFVAAVTLVGVLAWLVVLFRRPELRRLGVFVLLPVIVLMMLGGTVLYTQTAPVVPALHSYWLAIHVTAAVISSGILLFAGVASVLYLLRSVHDSNGRMAWTAKLPGAAVLDRVAYRATAVAFPIWTFAVIAGAIWAEAAWGRYWGWDPKETTAFIAWVVYAGYLHARSTAGWRGRKAAAVNVVGFAVMSFNLFFVNLVVTGLHSYAGVG